MREFLLQVARLALILLMVVYLPVFWLATFFAQQLRAAHEAVAVELLLSRARQKVSAEMKRRARR